MNIYLRGKGDRVNLGVARDGKTRSVAVPVEEVRPGPETLADLADPATNMVPQLGIVGMDLTSDLADFIAPARTESGVIVAATTTDQRADDIGLQYGDIIHAVDTRPVSNMGDLRAALRNLEPGKPVALQVERDGRLQFLTFTAN
jgi:S1-C subfamily serine protease